MSTEKIVNFVLDTPFNRKSIQLFLENLSSEGFVFFEDLFQEKQYKDTKILVDEISSKPDLIFYLKSFDQIILEVSIKSDAQNFFVFRLRNFAYEEKEYQNLTSINPSFEQHLTTSLPLVDAYKIKKIFYEEIYNENSTVFSDVTNITPLIRFNTDFGFTDKMLESDAFLIYDNLQKINGYVYASNKQTLLEGESLRNYISNGIKRAEIQFFIKIKDYFVNITISAYEESFTICPIQPYQLKQYINKTDIDTAFYIEIALILIDGFGVKEDFIIDGF